ncbi:MAG: Calx-beta domain-containing protein, partial [Candidatus Neomarinimicrobiota bacterium]
PSIAFSSTTSTGSEATSPVSLTVQLSAASARNVTVGYAATGGTASGSGTDYTLASGTATITAGATSTLINIVINNDAIFEDDETIEVELAGPTNATVGANFTHTYTIADDDPTPTIYFSSATSSGAENSTPATITINLSDISGLNATVDYALTGTASGGGVDYTLANGTATITAGATSTTVQATIVDDALLENSETIILTLSNPNNSALGGTTVHTYTITDNETAPTIDFSLTASAADEAAGTKNLTVRLSAVSGLNASTNYSVTGGNASGAGVDYTLASGTATITAGLSTVTVPVTITNDTLDERDETVVVTLAAPTNATLGVNTVHTLTITDNDNPVKVAFANATSTVSEEVSPKSITIQLSVASGKEVSVDYAVTGGTASPAGVDYTLAAGTATIAAGATTTTIDVTINDDLLDEAGETVIIGLSSPDSADLGTISSHTMTITDNDDPPTVQFTATSSSGGEGTASVNLGLQISAVSGRNVTVDYAVSGGTATGSGTDYTLAAGTATITAGATTTTVTIDIEDDALDENAETIIVDISNPVAASLGVNTSYTYTITDNDDLPLVNFSTAAASGGEATTTVTVTINLSPVSGRTVTVDYDLSGGTATAGGTDFSYTAATATFAAGETSKTFTFSVTNDLLDEAAETVIFALSDPVNATVGATSQYTYTITDNDDPPTIAFTTAGSTGGESIDSVYFNVVLSAVSGQEITVNYAVSGGTATSGNIDYSLPAGTLTIPAGGTTDSILAIINNDNLDEVSETIIIDLSGPVNATLGTAFRHTYTITDNDDPPVAFTVGKVTTAGTPSVAGYWNNSNTGLTVRVPVENATDLESGTIQVLAKLSTGNYENLGSSYTILNSDLGDSATVTISAAQFEGLSFYAENISVIISARITDIYSNSTVGTASSTTIYVDTVVPAGFVTGTATPTGGRVVSGYWNGTNTGLNVIVPIASDNSLINGSVQLMGAVDPNTYVNIGNSSAIIAGNLNASKTLSVVLADLAALDDFVDGGSLKIKATITDAAGNSTSGTASASVLIIATVQPAVTAVQSSTADGYYNQGDSIYVRIITDDNVNIVGTPQLSLETGSTDALANYRTGSGSSSISFLYIVGTGHTSADLDVTATTALTLNGGTIRDAAGNNLVLTLPTPGDAGSLADNADIVIDTAPPAAYISLSDSLVKQGDVTNIIVDFSESMTAPEVYVLYAEGSELDTVALTQADVLTWTYSTTAPAGNDGNATISIIGTDLAGNALTNAATTGRRALRVDNTDPVFSAVSNTTGAYVNHKQVGWTLSEDLLSGSILWSRVAGPGGTVTSTLAGAELAAGTRAVALVTNDPALTDGARYDMIFTGIDSAGNSGTLTVEDVTYDVTDPSVELTYSQYYANAGTVVTITATFSETMDGEYGFLPNPMILLDYNEGNGISSSNALTVTTGSDSTIWTYAATMPTGAANDGIVLVSVQANDLAGNAVPADSMFHADTLVVDNVAPTVTFSYVNTTQTSLTNLGKGGDGVRITAAFNDRMRSGGSAPTLDVQYGVDLETSVTYTSATAADSTWIFDVILPVGASNSAAMTVTASGRDLAGNLVNSFLDDNIFIVDNTPPAAFTTGAVVAVGGNVITNWINNSNDSLSIIVPVLTADLYGQAVLQYAINSKMDTSTTWATAGSADILVITGNRTKYREIDTVLAALNALPAVTVEQGDTILTRVAKYDRAYNVTYGAVSANRLVYDIVGPTIGATLTWNSTSPDTLISNDNLNIAWGAFSDPVPATASGITRYEWSVQFQGMGPAWSDFLDWTSAGLSTSVDTTLALTHLQSYRIRVRAWDVAGNVSSADKESSAFLRLNSAPVITAISTTIVYEDLAYSDTIAVTDPDLATINDDSFIFQLLPVHRDGWTPATPATISATGAITWTPAPVDTGIYDFTVYVNDNWGFKDTLVYVVSALPVNDAPLIAFNDSTVVLVEDSLRTSRIYLDHFISDEDDDLEDLIWYGCTILDTVNNPGYPSLNRGYNPALAVRSRPLVSFVPAIGLASLETHAAAAAAWAADPKVQVTLSESNDSTFATITADSNYFGALHRLVFYARDPDGAIAVDTLLLAVESRNDPPVLTTIPDQAIIENDSLRIDLGEYVYDVDDATLTFTVAALTNAGYLTISSASFISSGLGDSVLFTPQALWSDSARIRLIVRDDSNAADTTEFTLDIIRVDRPHLTLAIIQNSAFTGNYEIIVTDTVQKTVDCAVTVNTAAVNLDTIADYIYIGRTALEQVATFTISAHAQGVVGDTTITRTGAVVLARAGAVWNGASNDGIFRIAGKTGAVTTTRRLLMVDSTLIDSREGIAASYRLGAAGLRFDRPVQVRFAKDREDQAIYRNSGSGWTELPSLSDQGEIIAWTTEMGYFRLGRRTLIVPEHTSLRPNYPNPFNPATTIVYDLGFRDGPEQRVRIDVFNLLGQEVTVLADEVQALGRHEIRWDSRNSRGVPVASGLYFVRMQAGADYVKTQKIMLVR